jgi:hypothetical protein
VRAEIVNSTDVTLQNQQATKQFPAYKILIDLYSDLSNYSNAIGKITYYPQFNSWHNIDTSRPLQRMTVEITYTDQTGNEYPIYIPKGYLGAVKLVFKRKIV